MMLCIPWLTTFSTDREAFRYKSIYLGNAICYLLQKTWKCGYEYQTCKEIFTASEWNLLLFVLALEELETVFQSVLSF